MPPGTSGSAIQPSSTSQLSSVLGVTCCENTLVVRIDALRALVCSNWKHPKNHFGAGRRSTGGTISLSPLKAKYTTAHACMLLTPRENPSTSFYVPKWSMIWVVNWFRMLWDKDLAGKTSSPDCSVEIETNFNSVLFRFNNCIIMTMQSNEKWKSWLKVAGDNAAKKTSWVKSTSNTWHVIIGWVLTWCTCIKLIN